MSETWTRDGQRLWYEVEGSSARPSVLWIPALATTQALFDAQVTALRDELRCIRFDLRGHGRCEVAKPPYSLDDLGDDALRVLDAAGVERAHLVGVSIGGLIAQWLAVHAPHRVGHLVLANTAARIGTTAQWQERIDAALQLGLAPMVDVVLERWFSQAFLRADPAGAERFRNMLAQCDPQGFAGCCAALRDADLRDRVHAIASRALVVVGLHDVATTPADGQWLVDRIPGAEGFALEAAHLSNVEQAERFSARVLDFLRS